MKTSPILFSGPMVRAILEETFRIFDSSVECACYDDCQCSRDHGKPVYRADFDDVEEKWKPSIFMPRRFSRITLEVTAVRVERLQDISEADAIAEGIDCHILSQHAARFMRERGNLKPAVVKYGDLWESIKGPGSWDANPWVWIIEFKRVKVPEGLGDA